KKALSDLLKVIYKEQFAAPGYWNDLPELIDGRCDPRYGVTYYIGDVRDETEQRYMVLNTGDSQWYMFQPLLGETTIAIADGLPVRKVDLPKNLRRALAKGVCNGAAKP